MYENVPTTVTLKIFFLSNNVFVFCVILRMSTDYFPKYQYRVSLYNGLELGFLELNLYIQCRWIYAVKLLILIYLFMRWEKLKRPVFVYISCLKFCQSSIRIPIQKPWHFRVFLILHRLINVLIPRRNRLEFIARNHSIIPQANPRAAVTITSLRRVKKLIFREANGHRHSRKFPNLKETDSSLQLTLNRSLRSDNV